MPRQSADNAPMKRIHIALAVSKLDDAIEDTRHRLGVAPCVVVPDTYALFRTESANISLTENAKEAGQLRHLGIEDPEACDLHRRARAGRADLGAVHGRASGR